MTNVDVSIVDIYKIYLHNKHSLVEILIQHKPLRLYRSIYIYKYTTLLVTNIYIIYNNIYLYSIYVYLSICTVCIFYINLYDV